MHSILARGWLVRAAHLCDAGAFALLALAAWTHLFGGFKIGDGIFTISARSVSRLVIEACVLVVVRHLLLPRPSLRTRIAGWFRVRPVALHPVPRHEWLGATALYVPLVLLFLWPQIVMPTGVPDRGDPLFSMWMLVHIANNLAHPASGLLDGRIFYPAADTFLWSDLTLLPGLVAAPWIWAGVPVAYVYSALITGAGLLGCVAMFVLVRATTGVTSASWVAGALFGFLPYRFAQYSHLQMQGIFWMPLAVLALLMILERPTIRRGFVLGALVALQTLWSTYCGAYLTIGLGAVTLGWWLSGRDIARRHVQAAVAAVGLCMLLLVPYVAAYAHARDVVGVRDRKEVAHYGAELTDYLSPAVPGETSEERQLFPGVGPLLLGAVGLIAAPTTLTVATGVGLLTTLDASLGLSSFTYSFFYDYVPLLRSFRVPARFGLLVGLFLTWAAGLGLARLWNASSATLARGLLAVVMAAAILEAKPAFHLQAIPTAAPAIYQSLPADRRAIVLELPVPGIEAEAYWVDPSYLYFATFHGHTLINGYSGYYPDWYGNLSWASAHAPEADAMTALLSYPAEFIVIHEEHYGAERYRAVVAAMMQEARLVPVAVAQTTLGEDRLFEVRRD